MIITIIRHCIFQNNQISINLMYLLLQDVKEKKVVPTIQLNVIRLLAELNVQVNKAEVVDTILPLFIENLEEGDASTPSVLRLKVIIFSDL